MKAILINYNHDPKDWWLDYGFKPEDVTVYDRSDDGIQRTFDAKTYKTKNIGNVDYDKLTYLVEEYNELPAVFLWGKTNIFKYITPEELKEALKVKEFKPLLTQNHRTYNDPDGNIVCFYQDGLYHERYGIVNTMKDILPSKNCSDWLEWSKHFGIKQVGYIPFAPGGNYILTREKVHKYSRDMYAEMRDMLDYCVTPAEAQFAERSYYLLWK